MKLLLATADRNDLIPFTTHFTSDWRVHPSCPFACSAKILQHEITLLETGSTLFETTYKVAKLLDKEKFHLALLISKGQSMKDTHQPGDVLNIINEKPGDFGIMRNGQWTDVYEAGILNRESPPHVRGGFINMTNAYMNVFLPFRKAVGLTVNTEGHTALLAQRVAQYKSDVETTTGLGFAYTCLFEKQTYYHICFIERNLISNVSDATLCREKMNETLIDLTHKL